MKFFRKVGVQLHVACVEDGDGHSKCVECNGENVEDKEAVLNTRFGTKDGDSIEKNQNEEIRPDEITSLEGLPLAAARHHCHHKIDRHEGNLYNKETSRPDRIS